MSLSAQALLATPWKLRGDSENKQRSLWFRVIKYQCKESLLGSIIWNCQGIRIVCLFDKRCQLPFWVWNSKKHFWLWDWLYISWSLLKEPACAMNAFSLPVNVLKISLSEKKFSQIRVTESTQVWCFVFLRALGFVKADVPWLLFSSKRLQRLL